MEKWKERAVVTANGLGLKKKVEGADVRYRNHLSPVVVSGCKQRMQKLVLLWMVIWTMKTSKLKEVVSVFVCCYLYLFKRIQISHKSCCCRRGGAGSRQWITNVDSGMDVRLVTITM